MIQSGNTLVRKLDERNIRPDAAFWLYLPDAQEWKLFIVEANLASNGWLVQLRKSSVAKVVGSLLRLIMITALVIASLSFGVFPAGASTSSAPLAVGQDAVYALKSDGTVWAWGDNQVGELGNGSTTSSDVPVQVSNLTDVTAIAPGCALKSDGTVWVWGSDMAGELGNGYYMQNDVPVQVPGLFLGPTTTIATFTIGQSSCTANGRSVSMYAAPLISDGRTFIPVRYLADALGAQSTWDGSTQEVTVSKGSMTIQLVIGRDILIENSQWSRTDAAPVISQGSACLPAKYVAEAFGYAVSWDASTQTVDILAAI